MTDLRERLRKLGFREEQIDSLLAPPIYLGQTSDAAQDDFVSHETLLYMGMIPVGTGSIIIR